MCFAENVNTLHEFPLTPFVFFVYICVHFWFSLHHFTLVVEVLDECCCTFVFPFGVEYPILFTFSAILMVYFVHNKGLFCSLPSSNLLFSSAETSSASVSCGRGFLSLCLAPNFTSLKQVVWMLCPVGASLRAPSS